MNRGQLIRFRGRAGYLAVVASWAVLQLLTGSVGAADSQRPTRPTNLRATQVAATTVALAWNPSSDNSGSFFYVVREVYSSQTRIVPQTQTATTWTGLEPSHAYRFVVYAQDGSGNKSLNSNTLNVTTLSSPPPVTPSNLRVTATDLNSISLAWDPVSGATAYQVMVGSSLTGVGAQTTRTFGGLNPGTAYSFAVRASNSAGYSPWSPSLVASTITDSVAPTVPTVSGFALSPGVLRLSWSESVDDLSYVGYNVYVDDAPARSMLPIGSSPRTVEIHNLRATRTYAFTVRAYDTSGNFSEPSEPFVFTMPAGTDRQAPSAPANLRTMTWGNGISSLALAWDPSSDNVATMAYEVFMDGELVDEVLYDVHYPGVNNFIIVRQVAPGTTHTFAVKARDEAGNVSAASHSLSYAFLASTDVTRPTVPTITWGTTSPGCGFIDLMWSGAVDDVDGWNQLEYEIYEDGILRGIWNNEAFEASFGRHRFHIRAVDRAGNRSEPSNEIELDSGLDC